MNPGITGVSRETPVPEALIFNNRAIRNLRHRLHARDARDTRRAMHKHFQLRLFIGFCVPLSCALAADVVTPPESLVTENIPAIPATIAQSVGRYTEFRAAAFRSWHPQRREMLIRTRFADTMQLHRVG